MAFFRAYSAATISPARESKKYQKMKGLICFLETGRGVALQLPGVLAARFELPSEHVLVTGRVRLPVSKQKQITHIIIDNW